MTQRRTVLGLGLAALGLMTTSCGGGGGSLASVGSGGTGSTTIGPVSGFGSIIVGGTRYDDSAAAITDDSGATLAASAIALGMMVRVDGTQSGSGTGKATSIRVTSQLVGLISAIDAAAGTFTVLGQTVKLAATAVLSGFGAIGDLAVGNAVEVWGVLDAANAAVSATRVELKAAPLAGYKLTGAITAVNTSLRRFTVGALSVAYAGANFSDIDSGTPTVGLVVRVRAVAPPAGGLLAASSVEAIDAFGGAPSSNPVTSGGDGRKVEIEGVVSGRTTGSARFKVAGIDVDASGASFSGGTLAALANGDRVEAKGTVKAGVLVATTVELKSDDDRDAQEFELHGTVTSFTSLARFVVRGVTVDASDAGVKFSDGTAANLRLGSNVEIKGLLGTDGRTVVATEVKFDN